MERDPTADDVVRAQGRLRPWIRHTPTIRSDEVDELVGVPVWFKCENLQRSGAFKARGAFNAVLQLDPDVARRGVAAHSSGNHAGALALAGQDLGIPVTVVMPTTTVPFKREAVLRRGAKVIDCEPTLEARAQTLAAFLAESGATEIHPYDNPRVIAGAGTAALELLVERPAVDLVIAPVGGGGLLSGTSLAARSETAVRPVRVWGAEPCGVDDAARSLRTGVLQRTISGVSVADGLLTTLSERTFDMIRRLVENIVVVNEAEIVAAMRLMFEKVKLVVEPSAAVATAALLQRAGQFKTEVGVILSGGNADIEGLPF